jgi:signal transduction histidine kinase
MDNKQISLKAKNAELEKELGLKTRELEIEAALERVRAVAMAMKKAEEMIGICEITYSELKALGFSNIRNAQITINKEEKGIYIVFEYSDYSRIVMREGNWSQNPIMQEFVNEIEKSKDALFQKQISGKEFEDWRSWRHSMSSADDPRIMVATSLCIYHYSIGAGALGISSFDPITDDQLTILKRFKKVFELTYTRYTDVARAEAQAKEARIETALERVRAVAMSMKKAEEVDGVCETTYNELVALGFANIRNAQILVSQKETQTYLVCDYSANHRMPMHEAPVNVHPLIGEILAEIEKSNDAFFQKQVSGAEFEAWRKWRQQLHAGKDLRLDNISSLCFYIYSMGLGALGISTYDPITDEQLAILKRFKKVFELAYTRYADVAQAEAQAKEAQIEAALEKVRASAMSMHKSQDINNAVLAVFEEMEKLALDILRCGIGIIDKENHVGDIWTTVKLDGKSSVQVSGKEPMQIHPLLERTFDAWVDQADLSYELEGNDLIAYYQAVSGTNFTLPGSHLITDTQHGAKQYYYTATFKTGNLYAFRESEFSEDAKKIMNRLASALNLTFSRFLDLQKAEEQSRESQIQLALERVRARTMAMQHSEELSETVFILFEQFKELGENPDQATIGIINEAEGVIEYWVTMYGSQINKVFKFSIDEPDVTRKLYDAWKGREKSLVIDLQGKSLKDFSTYRAAQGGAAFNKAEKQRIINAAFFSKGLINVQSTVARSYESIKLLERFAAVFDGTYTRFLDLKKAEAQAREAQIEASLERVRSKTMAMHNSQDVADTVVAMFDELVKLGVDPAVRAGIAIIDHSKHMELWTAFAKPDGAVTLDIGHLDMTIHPLILHSYYGWENKESTGHYQLVGEDVASYFKALNDAPDYHFFRDLNSLPGRWYNNNFFFPEGCLFVFEGEPMLAEVAQIFKRFAAVFGLTYRRYLDLQKAEAQAREAQIENALEKVRSRSLAMHKSEELGEVVTVVFDKLRDLGLPFDSAVIVEYVEGSKDMLHWIANAHFTYAKPLFVPYSDNIFLSDIWNARQNGKDFFAKLYPFEEKNAIWKDIVENTDYKTIPEERKAFILESGNFVFSYAISKNSAIFAAGFSGQVLTEQDNDVLKRMGRVFEQAYVRFLDLKKSEAQARETQIENALEKVRSRSLAMHKSDELQEVVTIVFEKLRGLDMVLDSVDILIPGHNTKAVVHWIAVSDRLYSASINVPYFENPINDDFWDARENGAAFFAKTYSRNEKNHYFDYVFENSDFKHVPDNRKREILEGECFTGSWAITKNASILMIRYSKWQFSEKDNEILKRFATVFEQAYVRFLDLQKAEGQAREGQIEASLERVRSKTMAMHNSADVGKTVATMFDELVKLGMENTIRSGILIIDETKHMEVWTASYTPDGEVGMLIGRIDMMIHPLIRSIHEAWKNKEQSRTYELAGDDIKDYYRAINNSPDYAVQFDLDALPSKQINNAFFFPEGAIFVFSLEQLKPEQTQLFKRFAGVFGQTYRRYLDLQKAEAQAREAQIENALEKVRSRSLAMHKSDELQEVVTIVFEKLQELNVITEEDSASILITTEGSKDVTHWIATANQSYFKGIYRPHFDHPVNNDFWNAKESGLDFFAKAYTFEEKNSWWRYVFEHSDFKYGPDDRKHLILQSKSWALTSAISKNTSIGINSYSMQLLSEKENDILKRFSRVFEQAYVRFLDLQKAEAQAREAEIELALERVRAKTSAMQHQGDLLNVIASLSDQLVQLGFELDGACFSNGLSDADWDLWLYNKYAAPGNQVGRVLFPWTDHPIFHAVKAGNENFKKGIDLNVLVLNKADKDSFLDYCLANDLAPGVGDDVVKALYNTPGYTWSAILLKETWVAVTKYNDTPFTDKQNTVLRRFANAFGQTYTRFLDLQKAEAQAREATIEASLERVRSKAMSMHSSEDLAETIGVFYHELGLLSVTPRRCGLGLMNKETRIAEISTMNTTERGDSIEVIGKINLTGHPILDGIYNNWLLQKEYHPVLRGSEIKAYYHLLTPQISYPDYPHDVVQYGYFFFFQDGGAFAWTETELSQDELQIYRRFNTVLSLTYRRYKDIKEAEAQVREAVKQASVDRVRADIASMRTTADLERITPLIWNELTTLGVPFIRSGVFIVDEEAELIHTYLSSPDGNALAAFDVPFGAEGLGREIIPAWRNKQVATVHWSEEEFAASTKNLVDQGALDSGERLVTERPHTSLDLHLLPFLQGMLYVGNSAPLTADEMDLVQSLADAFSTAYARYEDFNKLEAAKQQVEQALAELKTTQTQLVQKEKMASLGELTAGIAHEIQNPLNFVNNFSEVNQEMIDELEEELKSGNIDEALAIAADIKQNEQKINHHGKRADSIVKGMLEHSRVGAGEKIATNLNVLADEFLKLSYHGLRAKDKNFNAEMILHFDETLPKVQVVQQDFGRVFINLFNNAFYAVNQKRKTGAPDYKPAVTVTTAVKNGWVTIKVNDNGGGIPDAIKDKIMQPFFTTKPTGEGTGLGLSLSYDIVVKGHGGSVSVVTKEGEGSEFIIQLPIS